MKKFKKFNKWLALKTTGAIGTMVCAYIFTALALVSFPSVIMTGNVIQIVSWITQTFLQLVLLSVLMVGQNIAGEASEKRSQETHHIVKASHVDQMSEIQTLKELLQDAQDERNEMKSLMNDMTQIMTELQNKSNN